MHDQIRWQDCVMIHARPGRFEREPDGTRRAMIVALGPTLVHADGDEDGGEDAGQGVGHGGGGDRLVPHELQSNDAMLIAGDGFAGFVVESRFPALVIGIGERTWDAWGGSGGGSGGGLGAGSGDNRTGARPNSAVFFNSAMLGAYAQMLVRHIDDVVHRHEARERCPLDPAIAAIGEILKDHQARDESVGDRHTLADSRSLTEAKDHIDRHLSDRALSVDDVAASAQVSSKTITRIFKQQLNVTPYSYILDERARRARLLIQATRRPLAVIAYECGFSSAAHLSTAIRNAFGVSPRDLRKTAAVAA